jgi:ubiquinone/menaquinone biosynthesis C-methylase UbiE
MDMMMVSDRSFSDPYRPIAPLFPLLGKTLNWFLGDLRRDLIGILRQRGLSRILDLGCGAGDLARILADEGFRPVGLDVSPAMLDQARAAANQPPSFPLLRADGGRLPLKPVFDAALMRFVFHEMSPPLRETVWAELNRIIHPGGLLIVIDFTLPEKAGLRSRLGRDMIHFIEHRMDNIYPPHYLHYSEFMESGGLMAWIARHGGSVAEARRYFGGNLGLIALSATPEA